MPGVKVNLVNIPLPRIFIVAAFTNNDSFFWQLELLEELHCSSMPFKCFNQAGQLMAEMGKSVMNVHSVESVLSK